jgi:hypothetical protein
LDGWIGTNRRNGRYILLLNEDTVDGLGRPYCGPVVKWELGVTIDGKWDFDTRLNGYQIVSGKFDVKLPEGTRSRTCDAIIAGNSSVGVLCARCSVQASKTCIVCGQWNCVHPFCDMPLTVMAAALQAAL